ncbi:GNAT family N-acetyltransferase [Sulfitobacter albidus]|uniref:GNAT family N-acetyltransferase n=1 Tax=Sulfitobacter albidus TaxID=2829501 RepID=A0A975JDU9_9RHOB|nr:GNAT family N-acetyltransferase [Sulfitobacter albidus]QUJ76672.1 GNAT family N-acetyltransferase [Sulfitobacter albidus]
MTLAVRVLHGDALASALQDVARLRIEVFADWPYLYDGDLAYEARYLETYRHARDAIVVGAFDGKRLVGASTGSPLTQHADDFARAFNDTEFALDEVFYCAESVLLPAYRGQGVGHRFFDLREAHARAAGFAYCAFCAVIRAQDHPARPADARALDPFWRARGYAPLPGVIAKFAWKDHEEAQESAKPLQFWIRAL